MEDMAPFDVVAFLFLLGWFIVGYVQGTTRRIFGIIALLFSLVVAAQLQQPLGSYLASQWTTSPPEYSYMVAFGALFLALWIAISIGIQWAYHPGPLWPRYPALDELIGGVLGVVEGAILLVVLLLATDPYFRGTAGQVAAVGEFPVFRAVHDFINGSLTAGYLRDHVIPNLLAVFGFLFPQAIRDGFSTAAMLLGRLA
jgi:Colicin V production protein